MVGIAAVAGPSWGGANWAEVVAALATCGIAIGVLFAWASWLADGRHRDTETVNAISRRWDNDEMRREWASVRKEQDPLKVLNAAIDAWRTDSPEWYRYELILNFFEDLGAMEKRKAIRLVLIKDHLNANVRGVWDIWGLAVEALRVEADQRTMYENFELLNDRLCGRRLRCGQRLRRRLHLSY